MKKYLIILLSLIIIMAIIPVAANIDSFSLGIHSETNGGQSISVIADISSEGYIPPENISFINKADGKEISRSVKSLLRSLIGAVVERDFLEHEVKSLAVAYHTQLCCDSASDNLCIDISDKNMYLSEQDLKNKFGDRTTLCSYVDNVYDCFVLSGGKPVNLNISTFSSKNVENSVIKSTANPYNSLDGNYITLVSYDAQEFTDKILSLSSDADVSSPRQSIGDITYDGKGDVKGISIGGAELDGAEVARVFELPTNRYTLVYSQEKFTFTVMQHDNSNTLTPQTARKMAEQSNTCEEIINYFFG